MEIDTESAELRSLAEMAGVVRHYEQARELQERQRDEAERELDAWKKYEAAVVAKLRIQGKLTMYLVIAASVAACLVLAVVQLIRWIV